MIKDSMLKLGYNEEGIDKITKSYLRSHYTETTLLNKIINIYSFMINLGYSREQVIKMTISLPHIYGYSIDNIKQKIEDMIDLGYSREQVIKITSSLPNIYGHSIDHIKQKIEDMIDLGYSRNQVIKMTILLPAIYNYSINNINQKIEFYKEISIDENIVLEPFILIQSVTLSYARYMFLNEIGIETDLKNYRKLFMNQRQFIKTFGIDNQTLIRKYNYNEYMERQNGNRAI